MIEELELIEEHIKKGIEETGQFTATKGAGDEASFYVGSNEMCRLYFL